MRNKQENEEKALNIIPHSGSTPEQRIEHSNIVTESLEGMVLMVAIDKEVQNGS